MNKAPPPKYRIDIIQAGKYEWTAYLADMTVEPPSATSIMARSLLELMAKVLVAVTLRDANAGIAEPVSGAANGTVPEAKGVILTPNKRIITN
jgi:hypothetical protein